LKAISIWNPNNAVSEMTDEYLKQVAEKFPPKSSGVYEDVALMVLTAHQYDTDKALEKMITD
jgi:hypothetical protein